MEEKLDKRTLGLIFIPVAMVGLLTGMFFAPLDRGGATQEFTIKPGDGSAKVARLLAEENLIRSRYLFLAYAIFTGQEKKFQAGRYLLSRRMNIPQIVSIFSHGLAETDDIVVTVPEGFNVWEIDRRLSEQGLIKTGAFWQGAYGQEGYLFPDTYHLSKEETGEKLITDLLSKMKSNFLAKAGKPSEEELIVASLLEKEVQKPEDMALVAGVIKKRLSKKMLLQIDAAVAYGACLAGAGEEIPPYRSRNVFCDVTQVNLLKWLKIDGPFNTYLRVGLPPAPVANPGAAALNAARHPKDSPYLYYLSEPKEGKTIFSKTAEEHERNRAKYLR